jgi:hypothetical protein
MSTQHDRRYTVRIEATGAYLPGHGGCIPDMPGYQHVARFCGEFISGHSTHDEARAAADVHNRIRMEQHAHG